MERDTHTHTHHRTATTPQVYLAKWRETTVAVKVLGNLGAGASPGLDDEFPDAASAAGHPLYESLQKVRRREGGGALSGGGRRPGFAL